jgi:hypothetical protein
MGRGTSWAFATLLAALGAAAAFAGEERSGGAARGGKAVQAGPATDPDQRVPDPDQLDNAPHVAARGPALPPLPRFLPPERGLAPARFGGATRGAEANELPAVEALVPVQTGLTLEAKPVLYWYLSRPTDVRVDLRVLALDPLQTVLERTLPPARQAGVQRIRLADYGVELAPGRAYQWLVLLVPNPEDRSYDRIVGGGIERIEPDPKLRERLSGATRERLPYLLAEAGVWYDAIDVLSQEIDAHPGDAQLWNRRAALFEQVGLPDIPLATHEAAAFEPR